MSEPDPLPPRDGDDRTAALRPALAGATLRDDEVMFIDQSLRASSTDYTEDGLATYLEWGLTAVVSTTDDAYELGVSGARVNAEWEMRIDRQTGAVTIEMTATEAPMPPPD